MNIEELKGQLIVSCQPVAGGPMDKIDTIVEMARAAVAGGAAGLRIEGVTNVRAVRAALQVPIVGIVKRDLNDSPVRITPFEEDVYALAEAGADIIAVDATDRRRPVTVPTLLGAIHNAHCMAMADCATEADGIAAAALGFEFVATTLSGYTEETFSDSDKPDFALIANWYARGLRVVAEGRVKTPQEAARALHVGAFSVTVGSAITRVEHITEWFVQSLSRAGSSREEEQP